MTKSGFDRKSTLELLAYSEDLPSLPDRFVKIQAVIQDPDSDARDLADVIRSDQATSAMILKFANSVAFNPSNAPIGELSKAIARLGSRETAHIATTMSLMYGMILPTGMSNIRTFWAHAFATGIVTERLAQEIDPAEKHCTHELAFMTGLLHDIGRAALGMRVDFSYFERETGHLHGPELIAAEEQFYGVNHAEAGMYLMRLWHFPEDICLAIGEYPDPQLFLAKICNVANLFTHSHLPGRISFENIYEQITGALDEHPLDLSEFSAVKHY